MSLLVGWASSTRWALHASPCPPFAFLCAPSCRGPSFNGGVRGFLARLRYAYPACLAVLYRPPTPLIFNHGFHGYAFVAMCIH
ncbi:MAG: hypothetical protein DRJ69_07320 [Thermoprotei archaeon]|nr:MAG: hypothetical protein DRJ69_07320 [Thermoprotei archaeon]